MNIYNAVEKNEKRIGLIVFVFVAVVYLLSPVHQFTDSHYSMLLSWHLVKHRSFELDPYFRIPLHPAEYPGAVDGGYPKHVEKVNGHVFYFFPPGSSLLSIPVVALMDMVGIRPVTRDHRYNVDGEKKIEAALAAVVTSISVVIFFVILKRLLPVRSSLLLCLIAAFGSQLWSSLSRALWSQTWQVLLIALAILILLDLKAEKSNLRFICLATILSWMFFVRPTSVVPIVAISFVMILRYRSRFPVYALTGLFWLSIFVVYSRLSFEQLLPNYYRVNRFSVENFGVALAGNLISPSRGMLLYFPLVLYISVLCVRLRPRLEPKWLVRLALAVIMAHFILISLYPQWWAGHSFGSRFTAELVPWWVLLGGIVVKAMGLSGDEKRKKMIGLGLVLAFVSISINANGALSKSSWAWNMEPDDIDRTSCRLWDYQRPQFLSAFVAPYPVDCGPEASRDIKSSH